MRPRPVVLASSLAIAAFAACDPDEMCGCPPAVAQVRVNGRVVDSAGVAVPAASVLFYPSSDRYPDSLRYRWVTERATTDQMGAFSTLVTEASAPSDIGRTPVGIVRAGLPDTTRVEVGPLPFRINSGPVETVALTIVVP